MKFQCKLNIEFYNFNDSGNTCWSLFFIQTDNKKLF